MEITNFKLKRKKNQQETKIKKETQNQGNKKFKRDTNQ